MNQWGVFVLCVMTIGHVAGMAVVKRQAEDNVLAVAGQQLGLTTLADKINEARLTGILSQPGPFTVFGPTNEAFASLPASVKEFVEYPDNLTSVLTYHVTTGLIQSAYLGNEQLIPTVNGQFLRVNLYSNKVATLQCAPLDLGRVDVPASNGLVHVLDQVMVPPAGPIADTIGSLSTFSTLFAALKAAALIDTLNGEGPFTLLAPTDEAFDALPEGTLDTLLADTAALTNVLTIHVVPGTQCKAGLSTGNLPTLQGEKIPISVSGAGEVQLRGAIDVIDIGSVISVTNGVILPINGVLIPSNP